MIMLLKVVHLNYTLFEPQYKHVRLHILTLNHINVNLKNFSNSSNLKMTSYKWKHENSKLQYIVAAIEI